MERLTKVTNGVPVYVGPKCKDKDTGEIAAEVDISTVREILTRLAAYEDKGVAPEDALSAVEMAKVACKLVIADAYIATGLMPERVAELAQAEKDGRLVVLPSEAKEGDPIPQCFYGDGGLCPGLSAPNDDEPIEMCKRCWYCSCGYRQEAEEVLREEAKHG